MATEAQSAEVYAVNGSLLALDLRSFASTSIKLFDGGWRPLLITFVISFLMLTWRKGEELMDADRLEICQPSKSSSMRSGATRRVASRAWPSFSAGWPKACRARFRTMPDAIACCRSIRFWSRRPRQRRRECRTRTASSSRRENERRADSQRTQWFDQNPASTRQRSSLGVRPQFHA